MTHHGLPERDLRALRDILGRFSEHIDLVGLFGSRATGAARANSDIDLVLYGLVGQALLDRLWTLFDESDLARTVDLVGYDLIDHPPLKAHIDAVMVPLFSKCDLKAATANPEPFADRGS